MTRTGSTFGKLKPSTWKTFPLDDKEWPLKKESLTKTECSWFFNSPEEPFDRCVFQDLSENPILLRAPVAQLDRATDSGSVGRAFESLRVHQYLQWFQAFLGVPYKFYIHLICGINQTSSSTLVLQISPPQQDPRINQIEWNQEPPHRQLGKKSNHNITLI